jgi:simple sugar transport system permease protein
VTPAVADTDATETGAPPPRISPGLLASLAGIAAAWIAFDLLVWGYGESPRALLSMLFEGTWGTPYGAAQVLYKSTPLLFTGVAVELALRAGLFNIGAEGQLAVAGLAVGAVGASLSTGVPVVVAIPLLIVVGALAGAAWAAAPALLRARLGVHEVISTIMMNRIGEAFVAFALVSGLAVNGTVRTGDLPPNARLPHLDSLIPCLRGSAASVAIILAVACAFATPWAFARVRVLREIALVGMNRVACAAERMPVASRLAQAMLLSGALAGLTATATVLGYKGHFESGLGAGAGFGGIAVAMLGRGSAVGLVASALLFGTLDQGGLAINAYVPMEAMQVLEGVIIVAVALADARVRAGFVRALPRLATRKVKGA